VVEEQSQTMDDWKNFVWGFFRTQPKIPPQIQPRTETDQHDQFFNSDHSDELTRPWNESDPSNFGSFFGSSFSMMGNVFAEMERLVKDMDEAFRDFQPFMPDISREGFENPNFLIPPSMDKFPAIEDGSMKESSPNPDANLRDHMLKKGYEEPSSSKKKVDGDLDELYKESSLDLSKAPVPFNRNLHENQQPKVRSSFESVTSQYSYSNGKWVGKTVKRTNEGEEITTFSQNAKGEMEENKEFRPRGSEDNLPLTSNDSNWFGQQSSSSYSDPFRIMDKFFRPRI